MIVRFNEPSFATTGAMSRRVDSGRTKAAAVVATVATATTQKIAEKTPWRRCGPILPESVERNRMGGMVMN